MDKFQSPFELHTFTQWIDFARELNDISDQKLLDMLQAKANDLHIPSDQLEIRINVAQTIKKVLNESIVPLTSNEIELVTSFINGYQATTSCEELVVFLEKVIRLIKKDEHLVSWGIFQMEYGTNLLKSRAGDQIQQGRDSEQAMLLAIQAFDESGESDLWAVACGNLGGLYIQRASPNKEIDIDKAIEILLNAIEYLTNQPLSLDVLFTYINLGNAYSKRTSGKLDQNYALAVKAYKEALRISNELSRDEEVPDILFQLGNVYARQPSSENFYKSASFYRQAIEMYEHHADQFLVANTYFNLGVLYGRFNGREKARYLREAVECFDRALKVTNVNEFPEEYAETLLSLGRAYLRIENSTEFEIEKAIGYIQYALEYYGGVKNVAKMGECLNDLGSTYASPKMVIKNKNKLIAEAYFLHAETCFSQIGDIKKKLSASRNLATVITPNADENQQDVIQKSIQIYTSILPIQIEKNFDDDVADTCLSLGIAYARLFRGTRSENIRLAVEYFMKALDYYDSTRFPRDRASILYNLGLAYREYRGFDFANAAEESIKALEEALKLINQRESMSLWLDVKRELSTGYTNRILGDSIENHEKALRHATEMSKEVDFRDSSPAYKAKAIVTLADVYLNSPLGDRGENTRRAISGYKQALQILNMENGSEGWAQCQYNLGLAYSKDRSSQIALQQAAISFLAALTFYTQVDFPEEWAMLQINLGSLFGRSSEAIDSKNIKLATEYFEGALKVYTQENYPVDWALTLLQLGISNSRIRDKANQLIALRYYREALKVFTKDDFPQHWFVCISQVAEAEFLLRNIGGALNNAMQGIAYVDQLLNSSATDVSKYTHFSNAGKVYEIAAYCLAVQGDVENALTILDRGKSRVLAEALDLTNYDLSLLNDEERENLLLLTSRMNYYEEKLRNSQWSSKYNTTTNSELVKHHRKGLMQYFETLQQRYPEFAKRPYSLANIAKNLTENCVVVVPLITDLGTVIFFLTTSLEGDLLIQTETIDSFLKSDLFGLAIGDQHNHGFLLSYRQFKESGRSDDFDSWLTTMENVTSSLWKSLVVHVVDKLKVIGRSRVFVISQGLLQVIPVHAAWTNTNGTRKYFADDYVVSYASSIRILDEMLSRLKSRQVTKNLLISVNPSGDLMFAEEEGEAVLKYFDETSVLQNREQAISQFVRRAPEYSYFHFACHGTYDFDNKWKTGLLLGEDQFLTLSQILKDLNLKNARLVTLSACETGMSDLRDFPEESISLPNGFFRSGAIGILSTLWVVDDYATRLLIDKFYSNCFDKGLEPAEALALAQKWLQKIYPHPYHWAAFYLTGI